MSSELAIAAVSAVLRNLLDDGVIDVGPAIPPPTVSAVAPDTIRTDDPNMAPRLNLFLYRVTPNQGWVHADLPAFGTNGSRRGRPPLALDLHYLLTAYGTADFQAEILLGYGMKLLHDHPVLDRESIRIALDPSPLGASILPPEFQALSAADLADQVEAVTVTLEPMDTEEMSRLWSAVQAHYRPSASYVVTTVLVESREPRRSALPVLSRGAPVPGEDRDTGVAVEASLVPPYPTIERVVPAEPADPAAVLGTTITLSGHHLDGTAVVVSFEHRLLDDPIEVPVPPNDDPDAIEVDLPDAAVAAADWPAGIWTVSVVLVGDDLVERTTNVAAMLLAPQPQLGPTDTTVVRDPVSRRVSVQLGVLPEVRPAQVARLSLGADTAVAEPLTASSSTLDFEFGDVPDGFQWVRLVVDGVESLLVDRSVVPPSFDTDHRLDVPA